MESPNRSRALLALVIFVACAVSLATGQDNVPTREVVAPAAGPQRVASQSFKPARQSVALSALNRTVSVPSE